MADCEALLSALLPEGSLSRGGETVDLSPPWERLTVAEAFSRYASVGLDEALATGRFDEVVAFEVEPRLGRTAADLSHRIPRRAGRPGPQKARQPRRRRALRALHPRPGAGQRLLRAHRSGGAARALRKAKRPAPRRGKGPLPHSRKIPRRTRRPCRKPPASPSASTAW